LTRDFERYFSSAQTETSGYYRQKNASALITPKELSKQRRQEFIREFISQRRKGLCEINKLVDFFLIFL